MTWQVGVSTGACTSRPILEVLDALAPIGVTGIELGTPPRHFDPWHNGQVAAIADHLGRSHLRAISIHAPFGGSLDLSDPHEPNRRGAMDAIMTAARALKQLGGRLVVVHPTDVVRHGSHVDARLHASASSLRALSATCRQEGLTLTVESPLPHLVGGHPDEFAWLLQHIDESAGVCLDTGHTWLGHHWRRFVDVAGPRLVHVHANDNHGQYDDHLPPGDGRLDWTGIAESLRDAAFAGWVMLELRCPEGDLGAYFHHARMQALRLLGG